VNRDPDFTRKISQRRDRFDLGFSLLKAMEHDRLRYVIKYLI